MWSTHIIVSPKLRTRVLESLHEGHLGVVKMKSLARSYVWWPGVDAQIKDICQDLQWRPTNTTPVPDSASSHLGVAYDPLAVYRQTMHDPFRTRCFSLWSTATQSRVFTSDASNALISNALL